MEQALSIEKHSKEFQKLFKLSGRRLGLEGEAFVFKSLIKNSDCKLISKNLKTPFGELDLVLSFKESFIYCLEIKTGFLKEPEDVFELWLKRQKRNFALSRKWLIKEIGARSDMVLPVFVILRKQDINVYTDEIL